MGKAERLKRQRYAAAVSQTGTQGVPRRPLFARVREAVVAVVDAPDDFQTKIQAPSPGKSVFSAITLLGTGFMVERGVVATAKHVVSPFFPKGLGSAPDRPPKILHVTHRPTSAPNTFEAQITLQNTTAIYTSNHFDLALLRLPPSLPPDNPFLSIPILPIGDSPAEEGDEVGICGYPHGLDLHKDLFGGVVISPSFSKGIVSVCFPHPKAPPTVRQQFQIDAMINPGNSGGPVFDMRTGKVVGVIIEAMNVEVKFKPGVLLTGEIIRFPTGLARAMSASVLTQLIQEMAVAGPPPVSLPGPAQP